MSLSLADIRKRVMIAILAAGIVLGSAFLWIGIPLLGMWIAGQVTTTSTGFLLAVLGGVPLTMVATGAALYRVVASYERLRPPSPRAHTARSAWNVSLTDERARSRRARTPRTLAEVSMTASATAALVLLLVWFFFMAEMPLAPMQ